MPREDSPQREPQTCEVYFGLLRTHLFELAEKVKGMWNLKVYPVQNPFFRLRSNDQEPTWAED